MSLHHRIHQNQFFNWNLPRWKPRLNRCDTVHIFGLSIVDRRVYGPYPFDWCGSVRVFNWRPIYCKLDEDADSCKSRQTKVRNSKVGEDKCRNQNVESSLASFKDWWRLNRTGKPIPSETGRRRPNDNEILVRKRRKLIAAAEDAFQI